jgi:hypothetical protein
MNPETLARKRWRTVGKTLDRRDRVASDLAEARQHGAALRAMLPAAERNDRLARGQAAADGKQLPRQSETERLEAELAATKQRADDLQAAAELVAAELLEVRQSNRDAWCESQAEAVERARRNLAEAADNLEAQISALENELELRRWVDEPLGEATVDPFGGRLSHTAALSQALAQVRNAVDGLAAGTQAEPPRRPEPDPVTKRLLAKARPGWGG